MRRRTPQGRWGLICILLLQAAAIACGDGDASVKEPDSLLSESADRANSAPRIVSVALEPSSPTPGSAVRVVVEVEDDDADPVKMTYDWTLRGESVGNGTPKLMLGDAGRGDALEVEVVASDGRAESEPASAWATVGNERPVVDRLRVGPSHSITAGEVIEAWAEGRDPEGSPVDIVYTWRLNGLEVGEVTGSEFETLDLSLGDVVVVEARADDGDDLSEPFRSPEIRVTNRPPTVVSRPGPSRAGQAFTYRVVAEDPDGDTPLRFLLEGAPDGMKIGGHDVEVRWQPRPDQAGVHEVRVVVDDMKGGRVAHVFEVSVGGGQPTASVSP
jgi:hypothetical protein